MKKINEEFNRAERHCKFGQMPTYVDSEHLVNGDIVFGIMFDHAKPYWLVNR